MNATDMTKWGSLPLSILRLVTSRMHVESDTSNDEGGQDSQLPEPASRNT